MNKVIAITKTVLTWVIFLAAIMVMSADGINPLLNLGGILVTAGTALHIAMN